MIGCRTGLQTCPPGSHAPFMGSIPRSVLPRAPGHIIVPLVLPQALSLAHQRQPPPLAIEIPGLYQPPASKSARDIPRRCPLCFRFSSFLFSSETPQSPEGVRRRLLSL